MNMQADHVTGERPVLHWRRIARAFLLASVSISVALPAQAVRAQPQASAAESLPALTSMAQCVRENRALDALFVIDASGSLRSTDPNDQRVTAAKAAVESLAGLAEHDLDGERPVVSVSVASFGVAYQEEQPWTALDYSSVEVVKASIENLKPKDREVDTDYAAALLGAKRSLDARKPTNPPTCRALIWFTDGRYDIEEGARRATPTKDYAPDIRLDRRGGPDRLEKFGLDLLCRPDGLIDEIRTGEIGNLAVGLRTQLAPKDEDFLAALTTGKGPGGSTCGAVDAAKAGAYVPVNDLTELIATFDAIGAALGYGVQGPPQLDVPVCAGSTCPEGRRPFAIDIGESHVHLNVQTGGDDIDVVLSSPTASVTLNAKSGTSEEKSTIGTVALRVVWLSPDVVSIDIELPPAEETWSGEWAITFAGPKARSSGLAPGFRHFHYGSTSLGVESGSGLLPSGSTEVRLELLASKGGPKVSAKFLAETKVRLAGVVVDSAQKKASAPTVFDPSGLTTFEIDPTDGSASATLATPAGIAKPDIEALVQVTTKSGLALAPSRIRLQAPIVDGSTSRKGGASDDLPFALLGGGAALLAFLGALVGIVLRRRSQFAPLGDIHVAIHRARVAFDAVNRPRVVWLNDDNAESQLRLNAANFTTMFPSKRKRAFEAGPFRFTRTSKDLGRQAVVEGADSLLLVGPTNSTFADGRVGVNPDLHPLWAFSCKEVRLGLTDRSGGMTSDLGNTFDYSRIAGSGSGERALDGWLLIAATDDSELAAVERSINTELPSLAREALRDRAGQ